MKWTQRLLLSLVVGSLVAITLVGMDDGTLEARSMRVVAGTGEAGFEDGSPGKFNKPIRLAPYGEGAVLVADIFNHAIRVVTVDGEVRTISGAPDRKGYEDGSASAARFASPHGVAVSRQGVIAVAEAENHTIRLLVPAADPQAGASPEYVVSTLAGMAGQGGMRDGPAVEALFQSPHAVAWTVEDDLLLADIGNARIRVVDSGSVRTVAGSGAEGSNDGEADVASFHYPMDIALAADGTLWIADAGSHSVRSLDSTGRVSTLILERPIDTPHGIAVGPDGLLYIAEMGTHRVLAIDRDGRVTPICGTGEAGSGPDRLNRPAAVLMHDGDLWVADLDNHRIVICQAAGATARP